ncbi:hypothetical protein RRG08_021303 [Elysia crispata]|uniref:Uncharacterized protein n=1 Tax=Elysia crispata TaxID=231223 RepID=A0AAE0ZA75_9GAST|nr:hypothetical protein RRG08_021303 [Elysia crispata]
MLLDSRSNTSMVFGEPFDIDEALPCAYDAIDVVKGDHSGAGETREAPVYFQLALSRGQMGSNSAVSKHVLSGLFPFADGQFIWVYEISEFVYSERSNQAKRLGSSKLVW